MQTDPKQARLELGLNKSQMARAMGATHPNTWRKWEDGSREMDASKIRLLETLLALKEKGMLDWYLKYFSC